MAQGNVIKEFLISLGFKIDTPSFKKFGEGLDIATKRAIGLGTAVAGIATGVAIFVTKFAESAEKLHFLSQRTGASANNIKALRAAYEQVGLSAEEANGDVEALGNSLRNWGKADYLKSLGIEGKDTGEKLKNLLAYLSKFKSEQLAFSIGDIFGVSHNSILAAKNNLAEFNAKYEDTLKLQQQFGNDADKFGDVAHEYMTSLRQISQVMGEVAAKLASTLLPAFDFFAGQLSKTVRGVANVVSEFFDPDNYTVDGLISALESIGFVVEGITEDVANALKGIGRYLKMVADGLFESDVTVYHNGEKRKDVTVHHKVEPTSATVAPAPPSDDGSDQSLPLGLRQNNPGNLRHWAKGGPEANGFAVFKSAEEGLSAMAGNLLNYAKAGKTSVRDIISDWAPKKDRNDTEGYIKQVAKSLGIDPDAKQNMFDLDTLSKNMAAIIPREQGYNPFGMDQLLSAAEGRLNQNGISTEKAISVSQTNHITVQGSSGDASATGRVIGQEVSRVFGDAVRNNKAAFN